MNRMDAMLLTHGDLIYHAKLRNADRSALRARVNGVCKTWKTRPSDYRLPVKYGLRQCFYVTPNDEKNWMLFDPTEQDEKALAEATKRLMCRVLSLSYQTPWQIVHDRLIDKGMDDMARWLKGLWEG
jgi:hypothetical protein